MIDFIRAKVPASATVRQALAIANEAIDAHVQANRKGWTILFVGAQAAAKWTTLTYTAEPRLFQ